MRAAITEAGLTLKQERFAQQVIATGGNLSEAYRRAYDAYHLAPTTVHPEASKLADYPNVATRIAVLAAEALDAEQVTPHWIVGNLKTEAISREADASAHSRIRALEVLAKHRRMLDDHVSVDMRQAITVIQTGWTPPYALADVVVPVLPAATDTVDYVDAGSQSVSTA
mgnify:CR=1 FL=1